MAAHSPPSPCGVHVCLGQVLIPSLPHGQEWLHVTTLARDISAEATEWPFVESSLLSSTSREVPTLRMLLDLTLWTIGLFMCILYKKPTGQ